MAAGRVVADVQAAALDVCGKAREGAIPHHNSVASCLCHCPFHSFGLFAARAFVDQDGPRQPLQQLRFERIGNALQWVFAHAETGRRSKPSRVQTRCNIRAGPSDAEGFGNPTLRQGGERVTAVHSIGAALEEIVIFFLANGEQTELGQT